MPHRAARSWALRSRIDTPFLLRRTGRSSSRRGTVLYYGGQRDGFTATPTVVAERLALLLRRLGARLHRLREVAGITQEAAAHRAGIDVKRWQRLEAGLVNPTVRTLDRAAHALGTDFWSVARWTDGEDSEVARTPETRRPRSGSRAAPKKKSAAGQQAKTRR